MKITLLKLGGSLITDKARTRTARHAEIHRITGEIARARAVMGDRRLLLGNGAGSFAHRSAHQYGTMDGFSDAQGRYGACIAHQDAMRLNQIIMESLLAADLPAFSVQPSAFITTADKQVSLWSIAPIEILLQRSIIPVIYGDVIADAHIGSTIHSTDTLFRIVAEELLKKGHTMTIIHAGNYPGVLDADGSVIPHITPSNFSTFTSLHASAETDVTGGMKLKVGEMVTLATHGIESMIIDGSFTDNIFRALSGESIGTKIA